MIEKNYTYNFKIGGFICPERGKNRKNKGAMGKDDDPTDILNCYEVSIESSSWFTTSFIMDVFNKIRERNCEIYQEDLCDLVFFDLSESEKRPNTFSIRMVGEHEGVQVISEMKSEDVGY